MLIDSSFAGFVPKAFEGKFTQIKKSRRSERKSPITIKYQYPKNIRMVVNDEDAPLTYVCNSKKAWIYTPAMIKGEKGQVKEGTSSKYCYSNIFDVMKFGLKTNKYYKVINNKDNSYSLDFNRETAEKVGFKTVSVRFKALPKSFQTIKTVTTKKLGAKKAYKITLSKNTDVQNILKDFIKNEFKKSKEYSVKKLNFNSYVLTFSKKEAKKNKLEKVMVSFKNSPLTFENIVHLELKNQNNKKPVILKKNEIKVVKNINQNVFEFKVPDNTEIEVMN